MYSLKFALFADNTVVYLTINSPNNSANLQKDFDLLQEWEAQWDMEFNPGKCQVLHITRARNPIKSTYTMHSKTLQSVSSTRYLGVDLSTNLSFNTHINRITSNASKSLGFIKRNSKIKHKGVREAAYKIIVPPQLEYASTAWSPYTQNYTQKIEMVQRRAAHWTINDYSPSGKHTYKVLTTLNPTFIYVVKLGFTGVYNIFLILLKTQIVGTH